MRVTVELHDYEADAMAIEVRFYDLPAYINSSIKEIGLEST